MEKFNLIDFFFFFSYFRFNNFGPVLSILFYYYRSPLFLGTFTTHMPQRRRQPPISKAPSGGGQCFSQKEGDLKNERWIFNGQFLESVDNFDYLGTVFNYTGTFNLNQEYLSGKALKALNVLLNNCLKYKLKTSILCQLFDAFVGSILNYSSETWGFSKSKAIERIHLKFCKRILQVRTCTNTMAVYGDLGRFPMYILRYHKIIGSKCCKQKILYCDKQFLPFPQCFQKTCTADM